MIGLRRRRRLQRLLVKAAELVHQLIQTLSLMALLLIRAGAGFIRHFQAVLGDQFLDGFNELQPIVIHQKVDGVAVGAAAKTMVKLLFAVHGKRRGFLMMEWTAGVKVLALLFELYPRIDQIDDVGTRQQVIDKDTWDSSSHKPCQVST